MSEGSDDAESTAVTRSGVAPPPLTAPATPFPEGEFTSQTTERLERAWQRRGRARDRFSRGQGVTSSSIRLILALRARRRLPPLPPLHLVPYLPPICPSLQNSGGLQLSVTICESGAETVTERSSSAIAPPRPLEAGGFVLPKDPPDRGSISFVTGRLLVPGHRCRPCLSLALLPCGRAWRRRLLCIELLVVEARGWRPGNDDDAGTGEGKGFADPARDDVVRGDGDLGALRREKQSRGRRRTFRWEHEGTGGRMEGVVVPGGVAGRAGTRGARLEGVERDGD